MYVFKALLEGKQMELSEITEHRFSAKTKTGDAECHCVPPNARGANGEQATNAVFVYDHVIDGLMHSHVYFVIIFWLHSYNKYL